MENFALVGLAGYIAPRHLRAIKETGNNLLAAYDPFDSVGIMDSYFPQARFFTQQELFDQFNQTLRTTSTPITYLTVCTPNYLHTAHAAYGLRLGANVVCEKPLALNPEDIDALQTLELQTGRSVYSILQLRLHPAIMALKEKIAAAPQDKVYNVDLTYITSRGLWYYTSWKGDERKSGGIATNIGVHFYDMLAWVFGALQKNVVHVATHDRCAGYLEFQRARVRYFLSINGDLLPPNAVQGEKRTYRTLEIDGEAFEFSEGFTELHNQSYRHILRGNGFTLDDVRPCIELVHAIRHATPAGLVGDYHPLATSPLTPHPYGWRG